MIFKGSTYKKNMFSCFIRDKSGLAAVETAMILPVLLVILLGMIDIGHGLILKKKTIGASQIVADLITRGDSVNDTEIDDAILAGRLAFMPYATEPYGVDIVSIKFTGTAENPVPTELWRETYNITANDNVSSITEGLGVLGEGVVVVTVNYSYHPIFVSFFSDTIHLTEVSVFHGRKSSTVERE